MTASTASGAARVAGAADAARLVELDAEARASVVAERGGALYLEREAVVFDPALLDASDAIVVVGTVDDVPLGYATAVETDLPGGRRLAVLQGLYVEPGAREVGVGEAMMELVLEWCHERGSAGIDGLALPGDRATKNFFERFGLTARAIVVHRAL